MRDPENGMRLGKEESTNFERLEMSDPSSIRDEVESMEPLDGPLLVLLKDG